MTATDAVIISSSTLDFSAQHSASSSNTLTETLKAWVGPTRPDFEANTQVQSPPAPVISTAAYVAQALDQSASVAAHPPQNAVDSTNNDPVLGLMKLVVEMLTGHKVKIYSAADVQTTAASPEITPPAAAPQAVSQSQGQQPVRAGFGIEYDRHAVHAESEQTSFQATGTVRTSDGKDIPVSLSLTMQRSFSAESNASLRAGDGVKKDPLVINFSGTAAQLQSQRFSFDLAGNGQNQSVAMLGSGSGYLALDLNGNGKIDSGKELFGTANGNGFADLARLDSDGNGWIDENDAAFSQLRVWTPDANGGGTLSTLQQKQVGALYLGSQATPFELKDAVNNQSLGAVSATGIYLTENGAVGSLQQIDLSV